MSGFGAHIYLFLAAVFVSHAGIFMQMLGEGWLVAELSPEPFWAGVVGFCSGAPLLLFSMAGGILADRWDRRRLIVGALLLAAVVALALTTITRLGMVRIWHVAFLAVFTGLATAVYGPAYQGFLYEIVGGDLLSRLLSYNAAQVHIARLVGPLLAGVLIQSLGVWGCFLLNSLTFLVLLPAVIRMPRAVQVARDLPKEGVLRSLLGGVRHALSNDTIRIPLVVLGVTTVLVMPHITLLPLYVKEYLLLEADSLGWLMGTSAFGSLITTFLFARFHRFFDRRGPGMVIFGAALTAGALAGLSLARDAEQVAWSILALGMSMSFVVISSQSLVHRAVADAFRGRVMGLWITLFHGMFPVGSFLVGLLAQKITIPRAWGVSAGLLGLMMALFALYYHFRPRAFAPSYPAR